MNDGEICARAPARISTLQRLRAAVDLLRPRTFFRTLARVDHVAHDTRDLRAQVESLRIRVEQLTTIQRLYWEQENDERRLDNTLDAGRIGHHVSAVVHRARIEMDPFPHTVVVDWLPGDVYETVLRALPPLVFFADREERRQRMTVPFDLVPVFSQRVWRFLSEAVVAGPLRRAVNEKFESCIRSYVRTFCPDLPPDVDLTMHASDGRIILRRPGYIIEPHRDPKWGFLTALVYLARKGDSESEVYGTQLYRVRDDVEAPSGRPYYIDSTRCELVKFVPFRPNTLLVFMNSSGAHGASISPESAPSDLKRFVYQFRLGPSDSTIRHLLHHMPPLKREAWAGSKSDRAGSYV